MPERITGPQFTEATRADACHAIRDNSPELAPSAPGSAPTATQPAAPGGGCHLSSDKASAPTAVLELRVRNHPGTMSHVTGLFHAAASISRPLSACPSTAGPQAACCCSLPMSPAWSKWSASSPNCTTCSQSGTARISRANSFPVSGPAASCPRSPDESEKGGDQSQDRSGSFPAGTARSPVVGAQTCPFDRLRAPSVSRGCATFRARPAFAKAAARQARSRPTVRQRGRE